MEIWYMEFLKICPEDQLLIKNYVIDIKSKGGTIKSKNMLNQQLADELHNPIIRKCVKLRVYSFFKDNIRVADLADMQLISDYNKVIRCLLSVIDIYSKYAKRRYHDC